jgi:hypothetical protein
MRDPCFAYGTDGASVRDAVSRAYVFAVDLVMCHGVSPSFVNWSLFELTFEQSLRYTTLFFAYSISIPYADDGPFPL